MTAAAKSIDRAGTRMVGDAVKPTLVFFYSPTSGASRRAEGFLAQVLQRRRNHDTFTVRRVGFEQRPDLAARLGVGSEPAIVVIEAKRVRARLERPRGCADLTAALVPVAEMKRGSQPRVPLDEICVASRPDKIRLRPSPCCVEVRDEHSPTP